MVMPLEVLFVVSVALSLPKILWILAFKYIVVVMQHIFIVSSKETGPHLVGP